MPGLKVGQAHDALVRTGVTVILPDARAVAACDVRGGGPGTRETDALDAHNLVEAIDAVVLSTIIQRFSFSGTQAAIQPNILPALAPGR